MLIVLMARHLSLDIQFNMFGLFCQVINIIWQNKIVRRKMKQLLTPIKFFAKSILKSNIQIWLLSILLLMKLLSVNYIYNYLHLTNHIAIINIVVHCILLKKIVIILLYNLATIKFIFIFKKIKLHYNILFYKKYLFKINFVTKFINIKFMYDISRALIPIS